MLLEVIKLARTEGMQDRGLRADRGAILAEKAKFHGLNPSANIFPGIPRILERSVLSKGTAAQHRGVTSEKLGTEDSGLRQQ